MAKQKSSLSGLNDLAALGAMLGDGIADDKEFDLINTSDIYSKAQPRKVFERIEELAESLKETGLQQPLVVSPDGKGKYVIEQGERRWRAAKLAGIEKLYCIIVDEPESDAERIIRQLTENIQRDDMKLNELVDSVSALIATGMSISEIARKLGKHESYISNLNHISVLPASIEALVKEQKIQDLLAVRRLKRIHEENPQETDKQIEMWCKTLEKDNGTKTAPVITRSQIFAFEEALNNPVSEDESVLKIVADKQDSTETARPVSESEARLYPDKEPGIKQKASGKTTVPDAKVTLPRGCKAKPVDRLKIRLSVMGEDAVLTPGVLPPKGKLCVTLIQSGETKTVPVSAAVILGVFS